MSEVFMDKDYDNIGESKEEQSVKGIDAVKEKKENTPGGESSTTNPKVPETV